MMFNEIKCHVNTSLSLVGGCIPWIPPPLCPRLCGLLVSKPTKWLRLFFQPNNLVMLITVYQINTGHRSVSLYNESNAQNKFTFKCWSCHVFNVVRQLLRFCALCFAIFADDVGLVIFVLQPFSVITVQYILIFTCDCCPNVTPNFGCHNIRKRTVFWPLGFDLSSFVEYIQRGS